MNRMLAVLAIALLSAAGCRSTDQKTELLERELRLQEDVIYELEAELERAHDSLASCRRAYESLERRREEDERERTRREPRIEVEPPGEEEAEPPDIRIEIPDMQTGAAPGERTMRFGFAADSPDDEHDPEPDGGEGRVESLAINRLLTGGHDSDEIAGDDGILAVIEPRDADGEVVEAPGRVRLVLRDPALGGISGEVARWEFAPDEASAHFKKTLLGRGWHFKLAWPGAPPRHASLILYVTYYAPDGRKLEADAQIDVDLPGGRGRYAESPEPNEPRAAAEPEREPEEALPLPDDAREKETRRPLWKPFRR